MIGDMKLRLLSLSVAALFLPPTMAAAQTMEFACPEPGTTFTFDSGVKVISRGRDGPDCKMDSVGGAPFKLRGLLIANPAPDGSDTSAYIAALRPERLWPLEVGKKVEARYSVGGRTWNYIEMNEQGDKGERSVSRWWISPADKYAIRFDATNSAGTANRAVVTEVTR